METLSSLWTCCSFFLSKVKNVIISTKDVRKKTSKSTPQKKSLKFMFPYFLRMNSDFLKQFVLKCRRNRNYFKSSEFNLDIKEFLLS